MREGGNAATAWSAGASPARLDIGRSSAGSIRRIGRDRLNRRRWAEGSTPGWTHALRTDAMRQRCWSRSHLQMSRRECEIGRECGGLSIDLFVVRLIPNICACKKSKPGHVETMPSEGTRCVDLSRLMAFPADPGKKRRSPKGQDGPFRGCLAARGARCCSARRGRARSNSVDRHGNHPIRR